MTDFKGTVDDFFKVRAAVATKLKENSQTQTPTRVAQAETLMRAGFIDVPAVLVSLEPPAPTTDDGGEE